MAEDYKPGSVPLQEQDDRKLFCKFHYKGVLALVIPIVLGPMFLGYPILVFRFLYLTFCFYLYYILNVFARGAAAFIYIVLIPICGIEHSKVVSISYYADVIFVTFGAVFMGAAMDSSKINERIAASLIGICGGGLKRLQLFLIIFAVLTGALINPTLSAAFWMKVAQAAMVEFDKAGVVKLNTEETTYEVGAKPYPTRPVIGVYLTCCYGSVLGAMMSPLVNPNGIIAEKYEKLEILSLVMIMAVPAVVGILVTLIWFQFIFFGLLGGKVKADLMEGSVNRDALKQAMADKKLAMGRWGIYPVITLFLIILMFLLVASRRPNIVDGWDSLTGKVGNGISVPVIFFSIVFFAVAANYLFCRYYVCREPEKPGTAPSLVGWKGANNNCPWADIFMLAGAVSGIVSGVASTFYATVVKALETDKGGPFLHSLYGAMFGTMLTILGPASVVTLHALPIVLKAGNTFALPFATSLHNSFLLPTSCPGNTLVSGWGNVRPYQFMIAGSVPTIVTFATIFAMTFVFGASVL